MATIFAKCFGVHGGAVVCDELDTFDVDSGQILRNQLVTALDQISGRSARHGLNPATVGEVAYESERARVTIVGLGVYLFDIASYSAGWFDRPWHWVVAVGRALGFAEWTYAAVHWRLDTQTP